MGEGERMRVMVWVLVVLFALSFSLASLALFGT